VHAILSELPAADGGLAEGELPGPSDEPGTGQKSFGLGRNSYLKCAWLPLDPPRGHGPHRYAFQLFALDEVPQFERTPGRSAVVAALRGHVIAKGLLIGTYERP